MKRRIILILCIAWPLLCIGLYLFLAQQRDLTKGITTFHSWAETDEHIYVSDNEKRGGVLYQFSDEEKEIKGRGGKTETVVPVTKLMTAWTQPDLSGYNFYKVAAESDDDIYLVVGKKDKKDLEMVMAYRIVLLAPDLQVKKQTARFVLENGQKLSTFRVDEQTMFITTLSADGQTAYTYQFAPSDLISLTAEDENQGGVSISVNRFSQNLVNISMEPGKTAAADEPYVEPNLIKIRPVEAGRYFSEAVYEDGIIYTRYDNADPGDRFAPSEEVIFACNHPGLSFGQRISISPVNRIFFIIIAIIGDVLFIALPIVLRRRKRVVYMAVIAETILVVSLAVGVFFVISMRDRIREDSYDNLIAYETAGIANRLELPDFSNAGELEEDNDFYNSTTYVQLQRSIAQEVSLSQKGAGIYDICYVDLVNGNVYISASGKNRQSVGSLYGPVAETLTKEIQDTPNALIRNATIQGLTYHVVGVHSQGSGTPGLGVIALADYSLNQQSFWKTNKEVLIFAMILLLAISLVIFIYLYFQSNDLRMFGYALKRLADGEEDVEKPMVLGRDLNLMWNSIYEIDKNIRVTNRMKYQIFEAYYRFAPKNVERILQKDSIIEVQGGDVVEMEGTMALLSTVGQRSTSKVDIERMNYFLSMVEKHQESREGIYVSNNGDLSEIKVLFIESRETISFGVELLYDLREWQQNEYVNATILLHHAPFVYGVAGTDNQSAAFLASRVTEELEQYIGWFRSMRLSLIITDAVRERESTLTDLRYIGFVESAVDPEGRIKLYEVLDASGARVRQLKLKARKQFEDAIELFYQKDFYLARNSFTEILKDVPEDELVTWYLFECEYYLNEDADSSHFTGALHLDRRIR